MYTSQHTRHIDLSSIERVAVMGSGSLASHRQAIGLEA